MQYTEAKYAQYNVGHFVAFEKETSMKLAGLQGAGNYSCSSSYQSYENLCLKKCVCVQIRNVKSEKLVLAEKG